MHRQREICLAPFPFSDEDSEKKRPVLVVSNTVFNSRSQDLIVVAITSNLAYLELGIHIDTADMSSGKLKVPSVILPTKIYTVSSHRIEKVLCRLGTAKFIDALEQLKDSIAVQ